MGKKLFIILYGERNQGKTSTLMRLVIKLGGSSKTLETAVDGAFFDGKHYRDARIVIEYEDYLIYVATAGDTWGLCKGNTDFFEGEYGNQQIYLVSGGHLKRMSTHDKNVYKSKKPDVVVSACSHVSDGLGSIKALHTYCENHLLDNDELIWLKRDISEKPDNELYADGIKNRIDLFL